MGVDAPVMATRRPGDLATLACLSCLVNEHEYRVFIAFFVGLVNWTRIIQGTLIAERVAIRNAQCYPSLIEALGIFIENAAAGIRCRSTIHAPSSARSPETHREDGLLPSSHEIVSIIVYDYSRYGLPPRHPARHSNLAFQWSSSSSSSSMNEVQLLLNGDVERKF